MKFTMFVLAITVGTFITGCDTMTPAGPFAEAGSPLSQIAKAHPGDHQIPLSGRLRQITYVGNPLTPLEISGYVDYRMARLQGNRFDLQLMTNARLQDMSSDRDGIVVQATENHQVTVSEEGVAFMVTPHVLPGSRFVLYIQFQITQSTVEVADQWLDCPTCQ
jgi:hypothetical protein